MTWDDEVDARGLICPLPVLRARKRLQALPAGGVLRLLSTDPAAVVDVPHFCAEAGHSLLDQSDAGDGAIAWLIRRAAPRGVAAPGGAGARAPSAGDAAPTARIAPDPAGRDAEAGASAGASAGAPAGAPAVTPGGGSAGEGRASALRPGSGGAG